MQAKVVNFPTPHKNAENQKLETPQYQMFVKPVITDKLKKLGVVQWIDDTIKGMDCTGHLKIGPGYPSPDQEDQRKQLGRIAKHLYRHTIIPVKLIAQMMGYSEPTLRRFIRQ